MQEGAGTDEVAEVGEGQASRASKVPVAAAAESAQPRALSKAEREHVRAVLNSDRFVDLAPAEVYATLLDEGTFLCSESTMYRILRDHDQTGDRRRGTCQGD